MAINRISYPNSIPTVVGDYQAQNALISAAHSGGTDIVPFFGTEMQMGYVFQVGGTVYRVDTTTAITGSQSSYVKITPAGATASASFVASLSGVSWNAVYNGYYDGSGNRYLFDEYKAFVVGAIASCKTVYVIPDNAVTTAKIASNAVTTATIASNAVTTATIASNAVTTEKIASNAVTTATIASNAVTTEKIASNAVTTATIADGSVTSQKINSLSSYKLEAGSFPVWDIVNYADYYIIPYVGFITLELYLTTTTSVEALINGSWREIYVSAGLSSGIFSIPVISNGGNIRVYSYTATNVRIIRY